jgi:hypothetical protein
MRVSSGKCGIQGEGYDQSEDLPKHIRGSVRPLSCFRRAHLRWVISENQLTAASPPEASDPLTDQAMRVPDSTLVTL